MCVFRWTCEPWLLVYTGSEQIWIVSFPLWRKRKVQRFLWKMLEVFGSSPFVFPPRGSARPHLTETSFSGRFSRSGHHTEMRSALSFALGMFDICSHKIYESLNMPASRWLWNHVCPLVKSSTLGLDIFLSNSLAEISWKITVKHSVWGKKKSYKTCGQVMIKNCLTGGYLSNLWYYVVIAHYALSGSKVIPEHMVQKPGGNENVLSQRLTEDDGRITDTCICLFQ